MKLQDKCKRELKEKIDYAADSPKKFQPKLYLD